MARRRSPRKVRRATPARWLEESERLYQEFKQLTPFRYRPFVRTFSSFAEYERWKRAQTNPWYR